MYHIKRIALGKKNILQESYLNLVSFKKQFGDLEINLFKERYIKIKSELLKKKVAQATIRVEQATKKWDNMEFVWS